MKRLLLVCLLSGIFVHPVMAALQEGELAPDIRAQASRAGKTFEYSLKEALAKGPVVVYFYPSAFTGGCNAQAHAFSENSERFYAAGASVIGVSLDDIARLNDFSADPKYCAGKVAVASDVDGKIAKAYELTVREATAGKKDTRGFEIGHGFAERTTFIVTPDGKIVATLSGLAPEANVAKALEVVQKLDDAKNNEKW
jgi:thioredoxin-dependent peroxiredoxin